jgi:hypothetical protein
MSSSLSLARVNGDTSFIITINQKRFLVDPWLFGNEVDGCSCFNTAMLVEPAISIDKIGLFKHYIKRCKLRIAPVLSYPRL